MKSFISLLVFLLVAFIWTCFLSGCSQNNVKQDVGIVQKNENIVWHSEPQGDFVTDTRDPFEVCRSLQSKNNLKSCRLLTAKGSQDKKECADGMSVAGCFACEFDCPITKY